MFDVLWLTFDGLGWFILGYSSHNNSWNSILKEYITDQKVQADFLKDYNMSQKFGKEELEKTVSNAVNALEKK